MIELGLMAGDPCATDEWTHEQQLRGFGWWLARAKGAPSSGGASLPDLRTLWREIVGAYAGLRAFVESALVVIGRRK